MKTQNSNSPSGARSQNYGNFSMCSPSASSGSLSRRIFQRRISQKGVSLIESLLVVVIIGSVVTLIASIPNSLMLISKSKFTSIAREIASKQIEDKRIINYSNLVNDNSPITDSRLSLLPTGSGTVIVEDCDAVICTNGEHIKVVTATITWMDNTKPQVITLKTMIGEGGINQ